ncbi:hypothetical protein Fot_44542 [Forsythia ovata]|uniref:Uncharacterized protein n=1 Tax=Forsythia ovata TaxID=205694 RepID=A0ABD1R5P9_9LAMI
MPTFTRTEQTVVLEMKSLDDIFEQVQEDDSPRSLVAQDEHEAGQSSPTAAPRAPLQRSHPGCEHINMMRQILEQIKKLTDQVDELKKKVDMSQERRQRSPHLYGEYMDDERKMNWDGAVRGAEEADDREADTRVNRTGQGSVEDAVDTGIETTVEGEADAAVDTEVRTTVDGDQEEVIDTSVDTTVEGEAEAAVDTGVGTTVEGDAEEVDQPRWRTTQFVRQKDVQEKPKVFLRRSKRKSVENPDVDEQS